MTDIVLVFLVPRWSFMQSWTAFTWPMTTGFTASRCDGFGSMVNRMFFPPTCFSEVIPKWYFTSPEFPQLMPSGVSVFSWNYANIFWGDLLKTFLSAFNLPRWAIPNPIYSTPCSAAVSTSWSKLLFYYSSLKSLSTAPKHQTSCSFSFFSLENKKILRLLSVSPELSIFRVWWIFLSINLRFSSSAIFFTSSLINA